MKHIAIFNGNLANLILQGEKTIETRFSKSKIDPFGKVSAGDLVFIKPSGKDLIGQFRIKKVVFYDGLTLTDLKQLKEVYGKEIAADEKFWKEKESCKYATLIFIGEVQTFITPPIRFNKRDQRGWVILD